MKGAPEVPVLGVAVAVGALALAVPSAADAQVVTYGCFFSRYHSQPQGSETPNRYGLGASAYLGLTDPLDALGVTWQPPGRPAIVLTEFSPGGYSYGSPILTTDAELDAGFGPGDSVFTISGGLLGTTTATVTRPAASPWPTAVPSFSLETLDALNAVDPAVELTLPLTPWTRGAGATTGLVFLSISTVEPFVTVFDFFGSELDTAVTVPADTLSPETSYVFFVTYSSRIEGPGGFGGAPVFAAFDHSTQAFIQTVPGGFAACNVADIVGIGGFPPPDGELTVDDYTSFINAFAGDELLADVVEIGGFPPADGALTVDDYTSFINAFAEGC